jgi:hypothetical protein
MVSPAEITPSVGMPCAQTVCSGRLANTNTISRIRSFILLLGDGKMLFISSFRSSSQVFEIRTRK